MQLFTDHPHSVGETYSEHFVMASSFGVPMIVAGFACLLHGIFPFMFERTGSNLVRKLHDRMVTNRVKKPVDSDGNHEWEWCI